VYLCKPSDSPEPSALLSGKGKYEKLAWDEEQSRLAFVSDRDDAAARQPSFKLYAWARGDGTASGSSVTEDGRLSQWMGNFRPFDAGRSERRRANFLRHRTASTCTQTAR